MLWRGREGEKEGSDGERYIQREVLEFHKQILLLPLLFSTASLGAVVYLEMQEGDGEGKNTPAEDIFIQHGTEEPPPGGLACFSIRIGCSLFFFFFSRAEPSGFVKKLKVPHHARFTGSLFSNDLASLSPVKKMEMKT